MLANVLNAREINRQLPDNIEGSLTNAELYKKGNNFINKSMPDSAMVYFSLVASNASAGNTHADTVLAIKAYNKLGIIDFFNRNYVGAYSYYKKALDIGGEKNAYWIYNNMAVILNLFKSYDDAEKLLKRTYHIAKNDTSTSHLLHAYSNLINQSFVNDRMANIKDVVVDFEKMPMTQSGPALFLGEVSRGIRQYMAGNYKEAIIYFKSADKLSDKIWEPVRGKLDCSIYIAKTFQTMNRPDSSLIYLKKAETLAGGHDVGDHLVDIYGMISDCYKSLGNSKDAQTYLIKYYALKDSLSSIKDFSEMKNLDLRYEVENYETRIMKANMEKEQNFRYLVIITVTLLVFAFLFVVMIIQNKRLTATNKSLFEKNVEILNASDSEKSYFINAYGKENHISNSSVATGVHNSSSADNPDAYISASETSDNNQQENCISIDPAEQTRIRTAIEGFFYNSMIWLEVDFGLEDLSRAVGSNRQYVSQVLNDVMHTNFYSLLNEHRINEARRRLLDIDKYGSMTIEAVAESIGYKSRSNFSKNFKKYTGMNPKEYIILARNKSQTTT